jgi:[ribosomal protein S5]-alanine N-acetyltransferase
MTSPTELRTPRLLLRPFRPDDVDDVFAYASGEAFSRYLARQLPQPYTRQDAEAFVAEALARDWAYHPNFVMEMDGRVIGDLSLYLPDGRIAELGYGLGEPYWGLGLTVEAASAVIDWGFHTFDIAKVFARTDARNTQSMRVMEKLGMQREAYLRLHRNFRGTQVDEVLYAVLRQEWPT